MEFFSESDMAIDPVLKYLNPNPNLPPLLYDMACLFATLAKDIFDRCPRTPERTVAFRKLLEAKDCAVRAML